ncbi:hypothetical protein CCHL11_04502 [Colletotrichum chlorophyti]|uniref:Uncharacterized protein n=1 Tax=Colletotrichum chlorophyti TaxID=708187 RepID=A0A1Q8S4J6_9PEZI|nr:hypothetical protein CCHL11_04502 [Colletotrichum chlorophyti]
MTTQISGNGFMRAPNYHYPEPFVDCKNPTNGSMYNISVHELTCDHLAFCSCPKMKAEPDISGRGVIIAFTTTAFITLCLAIFYLIVGRTNDSRQTFNPIDRFARKYISEPTRRMLFRLGMNPDVQSLVAYDLVNTFSDLQLVTGLAVLVGGIKQLHDGTISTYHFMIVTDLAWFCTNTHLLSLVVSRSLRDSVKKTHAERYNHEHTQLAARLARAVRVFFMAVTFVLVLYAFWVTGYEEIYNKGQYRCPMHCFMKKPKGGSAKQQMIANMTLMSYLYAQQIFLSWRTGRVIWMDHLRGHIIDEHGQPVNVLAPEAVFKKWTQNSAVKVLKRLFLAIWYLLASEVETMLLLTAYFFYGLYSLIDDRIRGHHHMEHDTHHEENELVYSQLVPIFLLIIPFMGLFESYARHSKAVKEIEPKDVDSGASEGP